MAKLLNAFNLDSFSLSNFCLGSGGIFGLLVLVCILLFVLSLGRTRTLISLLSIYVAFVLQAVFPYFGWLQNNNYLAKDLAMLQIAAFATAYIVSFLLLNRAVVRGHFSMAEASFVSVSLMGLVQFGLVAAIILNLAPDYQRFIPDYVLFYIANQKALFYWALAPLVLLIFQKKD